ncbi:YcxB family protein [Streptomyces sp. NPDC005004]
MEQGPDVVEKSAGDVVELTYRPVAADFASALRARTRVTPLKWMFRRLPVVLACIVVVQVALRLAGVDGHLSSGALLSMLILAVVFPLSPRLAGRRLARYAQRQGVFHATVTEAGISVATDTISASITWQAQPRYCETDRVFVLVGDDGNATGFTMLPKHGLPERADVDRLRAILDRHLTRC